MSHRRGFSVCGTVPKALAIDPDLHELPIKILITQA
jgi:hypothetical protein